jgi:hypothetical protein
MSLAIFVVSFSLYAMMAYNWSRGFTSLILNLSSGRRRRRLVKFARRIQVSINP